ncbi:uncharacterized protein BO96DRAFT_328761 [Aspergillus niger CBS 101883]|uniref:uncharacterized protein n=1 Tax=Aspergillus lacticoffeatus (strain CBS 101883) TaxID=1450533 RepID=UPI000D7F10B6|nr:uncharacterized protein BO96DRAFT_328761 [Aspergillus niger CBS 101883]PYH60702.1 hypothetical protein BO96DRAFT_328761 [Aspergillus niger CBS 101883]
MCTVCTVPNLATGFSWSAEVIAITLAVDHRHFGAAMNLMRTKVRSILLWIPELGFISDKHAGSPHHLACLRIPETDAASPWIHSGLMYAAWGQFVAPRAAQPWPWDSRDSRYPSIYAIGENLAHGGSWPGLELMSYNPESSPAEI